jgi:hypothetical protein
MPDKLLPTFLRRRAKANAQSDTRHSTPNTPLLGIWLVFRWRMRGRNAWRDLIWAGVLLVALLVSSALLQKVWAQVSVYSGAPPEFLLRWLTMGAAGAVFIFLPCAAILGAQAVPTTAEFEQTQSALLSRLTALDLCAGRLLATLWPLLSATLASCAFWLAAQLVWRFAPGAGKGYGAIFVVHLSLLCAVFMVGSIGFLFAQKRRPGRVWGAGASVAVLWTAFCVTALFLAEPLIRRQNDPQRLIETTLILNPVVAVTTALESDILRTPYLYERTSAPEYLFTYPAPLASSALFLTLGLVALVFAALRLRRAYR